MTVRILSSPYSCIKKGSVGVAVGGKFRGTNSEVVRVRVGKDSRLFRPVELRVLRTDR